MVRKESTRGMRDCRAEEEELDGERTGGGEEGGVGMRRRGTGYRRGSGREGTKEGTVRVGV